MNGRQLNSLLARTGMPVPWRARTIKAVKTTLELGEWIRRRRELGNLPPADTAALEDLRVRGTVDLNRFQIPELQAVLNACRKINEEVSEDLEKTEGFNNRNLLSAEQLHRHPELLKLAENSGLVSTISAYLGQVPVIGSMQLWLSKPNPLKEGSQLFHLDKADLRQVKLFLNVIDIDNENGPFTYIPADRTAVLRRRLSEPYSRVMDEEIESNDGSRDIAHLTGAAGTGALVDTCRCLHCGSRISAGKRLVLLIQYLPFHCALEPHDKNWRHFANSYQDTAVADEPTRLCKLLINARP